ncbi:tail fiber assembly protein [Pantoea ananatis]|uniref:tail fiber assembly protein n=1 Tax=Pantoea ananas TaxID=553 RepID=UPI0018906F09|nr:tail fiber assembly protein [Pantoea ananatis]
MPSYALVKDDVVINIVQWDGEPPLDFGEGVKPYLLPEGYSTQIGWHYEDDKFSSPPLTDDQLEEIKKSKIQNNLSEKDALIRSATVQINILQDAVDLDMATDDEKSILPLWKKYRIIINRIDANTDTLIQWPDQPK